MASKNHPERIASDAARGVGWTSVATRREVSCVAAPSQAARGATTISAKDPGASGSVVESELKRKS